MARKRSNNRLAAAENTDAPPSPSGTGAMDSLLDKLRAAAPQTKDQRERRRRARLKNKHDVRVASGQKMPDVGDPNADSAEGEISPGFSDTSLLSPPPTVPAEKEPVSEGEDIADRAASLLQGLRGDGGDGDGEGGSIRVRRRRDNTEEERARRRARRRTGQGNSVDQGPADGAAASSDKTLPVIKEPEPEGEDGTKENPVEIEDD